MIPGGMLPRIDDGKMAGVKAAQERVSYADLERWPEDGRRYELYNGEVFEIPAPILLHQFVLGRLHLALAAYVQAHGGVGLRRAARHRADRLRRGAAGCAVVHAASGSICSTCARSRATRRISPSRSSRPARRATTVDAKLRLFERHRVQEYRLVDPDAPCRRGLSTLGRATRPGVDSAARRSGSSRRCCPNSISAPMRTLK